MCQPEDVGLSLGDFAAATTPNTIERDTPNRIALDLSDMELRREMEARGLKPTGFKSADAKKLQEEFDTDRARIIEEKKAKAAENAEEEQMELAVERNKTIMSRLLSGELSAWDDSEMKDVRVLCRLMVMNQTNPKLCISLLRADDFKPNIYGKLARRDGGGVSSNSNSSSSSASLIRSFSPANTHAGPGVLLIDARRPDGMAEGAQPGVSERASYMAHGIAKCLVGCRSVVTLDLSACGLNDLAGCFLARCLAHNSVLESLELKDNKLGPRTLSELAASLDPHECHHERATNPLRATNQRTMTEEDWLELDLHERPETHTPTMSRLRNLRLDDNPVTSGGEILLGIEEFASMLVFNNTLTQSRNHSIVVVTNVEKREVEQKKKNEQ